MKSQAQSNRDSKWSGNGSASSIGIFAEQAFWRAAGARLIPGNSARILKDAAENYPAWLGAIESARHTIHFESYVIHEDEQGQIFADGLISFVSGLCVGRMWVGDKRAGIEPWRDTGIEIRGPAVAELERAFAQMWAACGRPIPPGEFPDSILHIHPIPPILEDGDVALRIVASMPYSAGLYRLDQVIAAAARETLWLTDAYFAGTTPYVQALSAASRDGVDVRLLVPQATDIPVVRALSRIGYRPLLESGVRVYEWNGPMIHAKT